MDDADRVAELIDRENANLIARHLRREPPPRRPQRDPARLDRVLDSHSEDRR